MTLSEEQWHLLATGAFATPVRIITIDPTLSVRMGVGTVSVWIRPEYVQKIRFKHGTPPDLFQHIPTVIRTGAAYVDARDGNCLQIYHEIDGKTYRLVLKGIPLSNEIWVSTFHYIGESEARRRLKKMNRIR
jgi:hypothetical protein